MLMPYLKNLTYSIVFGSFPVIFNAFSLNNSIFSCESGSNAAFVLGILVSIASFILPCIPLLSATNLYISISLCPIYHISFQRSLNALM